MKADHKAALEYAERCNANQYYLTEGVQILAAAYLERTTQLEQANKLNETLTRDLLELRELVKKLEVGHMQHCICANCENLRAAIGEE